jgi:hypothetical protein
LTLVLGILTGSYLKCSNLQWTTLVQYFAAPSPTVRMSFPPGLTWARRSIWRTLHNRTCWEC